MTERARPSRTRVAAFARRLWRDRRGGSAIEYGLILALVVLAMLGALIQMADVTVATWNDISAKVTNAR